SAGLPPFSHQALLRADATRLEVAQVFVERLAGAVREVGGSGVELWGPVPAPMTRRAGRHRVHLLFQSTQRDALHGLLRRLPGLAGELPESKRVRWTLDVDPVDLF
ncbi:MAG: primosomal protein N', partial [Sedimenticolaceae bacterium]